MSYEVKTGQVTTARMIGVASQVRFGKTDLPAAIGAAYNTVYANLPPGPWPGHNVILYRPNGDVTAEMIVGRHYDGAEVDGTIAAQLPAGRVAFARHVGEYHLMHFAHKAIHTWMAANGHTDVGLNWEVYGDWHDDPEQRFTDVYYLLDGG